MATHKPRRPLHVARASDVSGPGVRDSDAKTDPVDRWAYTPPTVSYDPIVEGGKIIGFKVNPPFGLTWPPLKTLQHFAALIEHRTGAKVRVVRADNDLILDDGSLIEAYEVTTGHVVTGSSASYEITYAWLSGFENGIHEILWRSGGRA